MQMANKNMFRTDHIVSFSPVTDIDVISFGVSIIYFIVRFDSNRLYTFRLYRLVMVPRKLFYEDA